MYYIDDCTFMHHHSSPVKMHMTVLRDEQRRHYCAVVAPVRYILSLPSLAKNQVYAIAHMRDILKNVLPKFIKPCMETPCLCPFQGHKYGRRKPTETSVFEFSYLCVNSSLEELINIKAIFILRQGMFR